ncbi:L-lactate dehydrogenase [Desulfohalovibrio reitneri]|uniref:L-lactate dehydrogenase n=1 Tax=Desulfohalovibrio reitneri TaxID=1307759 RepID=UPI0004A75DF5|nr:L-lactate dehydrogenase [Desulfohalovibrio reitneri]
MSQAADVSASRVAVIGTGDVGATYAYVLTIKGLVHEMGLINRSRERAEGEARDINDGLSLAQPAKVEAGGYELCRGAQLVVITAGASQKPGETRLDLTRRNAEIMREVVARVMEQNHDPILLIVSNPVDVLTYVALKESGLPPGQVIGSGTVLDSSRFRYLLSNHCRLDPRSVHAHIIGEHGDSEFAVWSRVNIAGTPLHEFCPTCRKSCLLDIRDTIEEKVRRAAYEIIKRKGSTYYAVALAMARITEAVFNNQHSVLTVSSLVSGYYGLENVCLSLPSVVGAQGVESQILATLADDEAEKLKHSAAIIREQIESAGYA